MKCANCSKEAIFTVRPQASPEVNYCVDCLPKHLRSTHEELMARISRRGTAEKPAEKEKPAPKRSKKKTKETSETTESVPSEDL